MPTTEPESFDDALLARLRPQALLARGLEDPDSPPPPLTPPPLPASPQAGASEQDVVLATLAEMFPEFHVEGLISRGAISS